jgi:amino acid transporter
MLSVLGKGTTVEKAYLILLDTMLLIYFIPYIYLFICYLALNLREPNAGRPWHERKPFALMTGLAGLLLTLVAMVLATIPPSDTADPFLFRLKVIGGAGAFVLIGVAVYWRARRRGPVAVGS